MRDDRPGLKEALTFVKPGDTLVVWKLDRLGRSLTHLIEIINTLAENDVAFRSFTEDVWIATHPLEGSYSKCLEPWPNTERLLISKSMAASLDTANQRSRVGKRSPVIAPENIDAVTGGRTLNS